MDEMKNFSADEFLWDEPNEMMYRTIEAAERGENLHGPFESMKDLMAALTDGETY